MAAYSILMVVAIALSALIWRKSWPRRSGLGVVYVSGLVGAFLGAKIVYILAEGWMQWNGPNRWMHLATGKTILGALLGGYAGVEACKKVIGYKGVTGDWFALIAPVSILLGRVGCLLQGCCLGEVCEPAWYALQDRQGVQRWPAVPVEMLFNASAIVAFAVLRRKSLLTGQHFHLYLMGYAMFRFSHEFWRATPRIFGWVTTYQIAAAAVFALGAIRFQHRRVVSKT